MMKKISKELIYQGFGNTKIFTTGTDIHLSAVLQK